MLTNRVTSLVLVFAFLSTPICIAQEVPEPAPEPVPEAPAEPETAEEANWVYQNLDIVVGGIFTVLVALGLWTKLENWIIRKLGEDKAKIWEITKGVVLDTYHEFVKEKKAASQDGKLTKEEAKIARDKALQKLKEEGKKAGVDVVKILGEAAIPALIEKAVNYLKKDAKEAKEEKKAA